MPPTALTTSQSVFPRGRTGRTSPARIIRRPGGCNGLPATRGKGPLVGGGDRRRERWEAGRGETGAWWAFCLAYRAPSGNSFTTPGKLAGVEDVAARRLACQTGSPVGQAHRGRASKRIAPSTVRGLAQRASRRPVTPPTPPPVPRARSPR